MINAGSRGASNVERSGNATKRIQSWVLWSRVGPSASVHQATGMSLSTGDATRTVPTYPPFQPHCQRWLPTSTLTYGLEETDTAAFLPKIKNPRTYRTWHQSPRGGNQSYRVPMWVPPEKIGHSTGALLSEEGTQELRTLLDGQCAVHPPPMTSHPVQMCPPAMPSSWLSNFVVEMVRQQSSQWVSDLWLSN